MKRFVKAVCILTVVFLYVSTEKCNGSRFFERAGKLPNSGRMFAQLERKLAYADYDETEIPPVKIDPVDNGDGNIRLGELGRVLQNSKEMLSDDELKNAMDKKVFTHLFNKRKQGLSNAMLKVIEKVFKKFDENGNGDITIGELGSVVKKSGKEMSDEELKTMMTVMDKNVPEDNKVDYSEFEDYFGTLLKDPVIGQGDTKTYFEAYDLNGDGYIVSSELGLVMKVFAKANYTKTELKYMLAECEVNYDGKVTLKEMGNCVKNLKRQLTAIKSLFKMHDENGDGNITMGEFERVLKKSGKMLTDEQLKTIFAALDKNANGNVDFSEFGKYLDSRMKIKSTKGDVEKYFKTFDLNHDGFIKFCEISLVLNVFGRKNFTRKEVQEVIAKSDWNHDGKLSYIEFAQKTKELRRMFDKMRKGFNMLDENWDGEITLEELKSVMKKSGKMVPADDLQTLVTKMDKNGDNIINFYEFERYRYYQVKDPSSDDDIKKDFESHDFNGDGFNDNSELYIVMNVFYERSYTKKQIDELIAEGDVDLDGKGSYKEFNQMQHDRQHVKEIINAYLMIDPNWDWNITLKELGEFMNSSGRMLTNDDLKLIFTAVDKNGNGVLGIGELISYRSNQMRHPLLNDDQIKQNFVTYDIDGDGYITHAELHLTAKVFYHDWELTEEHIDALISEADLNCDEKVTYQEFAQLAKEHYDL